MESEKATAPQIRGKDLVGGIQVMPMGLDAAIKKRTSGEYKSEQRGGTLQFSNAQQSSSSSMKETKQMASFKEETVSHGGFQQASSLKTSSQKQASFMQSSSMSSSSQLKSSKQMMSSDMSSSVMSSKTVSSSETKTASMKSSASFQKELQSDMQAQQFGLEIGKNELKTQIESAITDLEQDRDFVDFNKENQPLNLTSPPQAFSPPPSYASQPKQASLEMFSPPPLEPMEPPQVQSLPLAREPAPLLEQPAPTRNVIQNGFSEFSSSSTKTCTTETQEVSQVSDSAIQLAQVMNGGLRQEETGSIQGSSSSSSLLQKIMTPASVDYDSGSLKRRDPRKMFTDSSFYNAKNHPTIADQVEMAHKLSAAMFSKDNKMAKGQQMFLNRAQNAGEDVPDDGSRHDKMPNLKLVMNPEGKIHEWGDLPADQQPDVAQLASHAVPVQSLNSPEINPVGEDLIEGVGKGGELFAKRRKRAENWVVDEASIGQKKPSAFADQFVQEQTLQQQKFQEQRQFEESQRQQVLQHQSEQQREQQLQQQQFAQQQFAAQQQFKQEQSFELRRQQEQMMAQQELELPPNFKHTDLKARGCTTPSLDLSCHNVQGINVWANTAPRGWGSLKRNTVSKSQAPPTLSVCPATPSVDQEQLQKQMEQARIQEEFEKNEREEKLFLEKQQQKLEQEKLEMEQQKMQEEQMIMMQQEQMRIQQEEQMRIQQEEQLRIQQEQIRIQQEQEQLRILQEQEQLRIQQEQEQLRIQKEQEEMMRIQQEQLRIQKEQEEQMRIQKEQEEQMRIQQEQIRLQQEQERIALEQAEAIRKQKEAEELKIQKEKEEQMRIQQQEEQLRIQREQEEQMRIQQAQMEQMRIQQEKERQAEEERQRQQAEAFRLEEQRLAEIRLEEQRQAEMRQQQEQLIIQQQQISSQQTSVMSSGATQSSQDLEAMKRKEYEEWFKNQEKEALEYSASVKYQETASESQVVSSNFSTNTTKTSIETKQSVQSTSQRTESHQQQSKLAFSHGGQQQQEVALPPLETGAQLAQPPLTLTSLESSNMSSTQHHSSTQQSLSSTKQAMEIYESQRVGYDVVNTERPQSTTFLKDSGVFGGISGDSNDLVSTDVDYKKHSVKDLAKHFACVKPKAEIPINVLPEMKMYNGQEGPALNYLGASAQGESKQTFIKKEVSQEDIEASKQAYEMKKKQQLEQQQQMKMQQTSQTTSSVSMRQQTSTEETKTKSAITERRQSLTTALLMDPAMQHSQAGIIDPSAILRGGDGCDGVRAKSAGIIGISGAPGGATEDVANKWDNHNAIARGWGGMKENYHPVTFRNIYNVESQKDNKNL